MKPTILLLLFIACFSIAQAAPADSGRVKYSFNPGWKLHFGDTVGAEKPDFNDNPWRKISLPHAFNEDDAFRVEISKLTTGIGWYRKHFKIPAQYADKKVFIEFEGVRQAAEIYLNGQFVGISENGVMAFGFDITSALKFGDADNVIAVKVNNDYRYKEKATGSGFQWNQNSFYANYGGINKNVYFHIMGKLHQTLPLYSNLKTTGIYVYANNFDIAGKQATVNTEAQVQNEYPTPKKLVYEVRVDDMYGKTVKTFDGGQYTLAPGETKILKANARLDNLNFWSWGYGYLYDVYTVLKVDGKVIDVVKTRTGFRKTEYAGGMVKLNDRVIQMHGYAQRTTNEWPAIGVSVPAWMSDLSNGLMVESNGNLIRWMHVTPWKQDIESCDRVGITTNMPAGDSEGDPKDGREWQQRLELMRDAMIYNRNNPSIMFYESGNKGVSEAHMQNMKDIRNQYDPNGGRASGSREELGSKVAEYGGEMLYINKSKHIPFWSMEYSRDEGLRVNQDELTPPYHKEGSGPVHTKEGPLAYDHNEDQFAKEDVVRWFDYWHERPGTGERVNSGGTNIIFSDSNTHFRGSENYRTSGEVDALRIPKEGFYAHKAIWDGWVDPAKTNNYIIGHWNYKPGVKKDLMVVSTGDKVELLVNGQSKGFGEQSSHFLFTFKHIAWEPGTIKAISYDNKGVKLGETEKKTAGTPASIKLTLHTSPNGLKADGADLALVDVEVVDAQGMRCPTALNMVTFKLDGPAEWRGGLAHGQEDNYILSKNLPVQDGINRVIIRSAPDAGKITLSASTDGLKSASLTFNSNPFAVVNGLSTYIPGSDLKSPLQKGPTPAGSSLTVTRVPIAITNATAGSNGADAAKSYDDNELTGWVNDGVLANGWIKYSFDKPHPVSEVTMKLGGWRTKRYPILIKIDGKEVYKGTTPPSLGYVTIPFKPTIGTSLTIELAGATSAKDAFGLVEVNGTTDQADATATAKGKSILEIKEFEAYQKP